MQVIHKMPIRNMCLFVISLVFIFQPLLSAANNYKVKNLVSNISGLAEQTDPNLINAWGLTFTSSGNLLVANNGSNLATSYKPNGIIRHLVFNVASAPTGLERNNFKHAFLINGVPAKFLFATEEGKILAFNKKVNRTNAIVVVDRSSQGAIYKGLTIAEMNERVFLYATDFHNGVVDVFDSQFQFVMSFTDSTVPDGFAPFNIRNFNGQLFVTFALLGSNGEDDQPGEGNGFVDIFSPNGTRIQRLISQGELNSPWGLAIAPPHFDKFSGALLVGNFGNGKINAYALNTGKHLGTLKDPQGNSIVIDGLWSLKFSDESSNLGHSTLYFTAGPNDENNGLLGTIHPN
jgi:uncharacterized protein (TIGR03118 family)